jgi:hypothetical protein
MRVAELCLHDDQRNGTGLLNHSIIEQRDDRE